MGHLLSDVEETIRQKFIPAFLKREISDDVRELWALPARFGGMGIFNPVQKSVSAFAYSAELCAPIVSLILSQANSFDPEELKRDQKMIKDKQDFDLEYQHDQAVARLSTKSPRNSKELSLWLVKKERRAGSQQSRMKNMKLFCTRATF